MTKDQIKTAMLDNTPALLDLMAEAAAELAREDSEDMTFYWVDASRGLRGVRRESNRWG